MEGRGSSKDSVHTYLRCPKWPRLGLMRLAFEDAWGFVSTWIGAKFGKLIPLLVLYLPITFRGNLSSVQELETILVSSFNRRMGALASLDLDEI